MKLKLFNLTFIFVFFIFSTSCEDAEIQKKEYPYVLMKEIIVSDTGVTFYATVLDIGKEAIYAQGFVWGPNSLPEIDVDYHAYISAKVELGDMVLEVNSILEIGKNYYVRPFIQTKNKIVYGNQKSFKNEGSNPPQIDDFHPKFGPMGTSVEITGPNLGFLAPSLLTVKFGNSIAQIDSTKAHSIYVKVPKVTEPGEVSISIEIAGMSAISKEKFDVYFPWLKLSSMYNVTSTATSFVIADKAYIINGNTLSGGIFDPSDASWKSFELPENSGLYPMSFSVSGKGYVILKDGFYEYDPNSNSWTQREDFPDNIIKDDYTFTMSFDQVGIIGFCYQSQKVWLYNPSNNTWIRKSDFPENYTSLVHDSFSFSIENSGYVGLRLASSANLAFWEYQLDSDLWENKASLLSLAVWDHASMVIEGSVYVGLGKGASFGTDKFWKYNQLNDRWDSFQNSPVPLASYSSFGIGDKGYVLSSQSEIWEFDPHEN